MLLRSSGVLAGVVVLGAVLLWRPSAQDDIHTEVQQRLLEAELGSARAVHFAGPSRALVPDETPTAALLTGLAASRPQTRWQAAKQLALRRDPRAVEAVIQAMHDAGGTLRVCVMASALGYLKDPRALSALTRAAFRLGEFSKPAAIPGLITALHDPVAEVQGRAAAALIRIGKPVLPAIKQLAAHGRGRASLYALATLAYTGGKDEMAFLQSLAAVDTDDERMLVTRRSVALIASFMHARAGGSGFVEL